MTTTVDDFMKIGTSHEICEDYVISGTDPVPHVILADGCSSSDDSDTGARILVHAAKLRLRRALAEAGTVEHSRFERETVFHAGKIAESMGLSPNALDATLLVGYIDGQTATVHVYGDGCVILADAEGRRSLIEVSYPENAPYYPSYRLDPGRDRSYRSNCFIKTVGGKTMPGEAPVSFTFPVHEYPVIMIASDGLGSFIDKTGEKTDSETVAREFTGFKSLAGKFLKRRLKRAIRNFEKAGLTHYDDISAGAFLTRP